MEAIGDLELSKLLKEINHGTFVDGELYIVGLWDALAQRIGEHLKMSTVTSLNFPNNRLSAIGVEAISKSLPHSHIEAISFRNSGLRDLDISPLGEGLRGSQVGLLNLSGNELADLGWLIDALPHATLHSLDVSNNILSEQPLTELLESSHKMEFRSLHHGGNYEISKVLSERLKRFADSASDQTATRTHR